MKVKEFRGSMGNLEMAINTWVEEKDIKIIDIKYDTVTNGSMIMQLALVLYEDEECD